MNTEQLSSLLLEIGTEEIPARFLSPALSLLQDSAHALFTEYLIEFSGTKTYGTPRRLTLIVKGIAPMQKDRVKEILGPAKKVAFDQEGRPTKAATGFASAQGITVSDLVIRSTEKGEYVAAVIHQKGIAVKDLLPEIFRKIILSLNFPKSMRWGEGSLRFVRPIHWVVSLFNEETVLLEIDGIKSGNTTKGHRFLSPGLFPVKEISSYVSLLQNNYVIVDPDERRRIIEDGIAALASGVEGRFLKDEALIETVTHLVEYPVPVLCEFPSHYLMLPKELLITVMRDHQKYFAIEDEQGKLRNHFVVISNTKDENASTVRIGAERVIRARFEDARFYYAEDSKTSLHARIDGLKRVTFHDRLGSLYDKTERVVALASYLSERLCPGKKREIERAAWLCKTDLVTGVVGEFPELQGLMGKYYALQTNEAPSVADALREHYLPSHSGDRLPESDEGSALSIADKMDNIVSFFNIGLTPTGSEDPFALRRQAIGIIAILLERRYDISLREIIAKAEEKLSHKKPSLTEEILIFFMQRFDPLFTSLNYDTDVIQSVIHLVGTVPLHTVKERIESLKRFASGEEYLPLLRAMKRIYNIAPKEETGPANPHFLTEPQEKALHGAMLAIRQDLHFLVEGSKFYEALKVLSTLTEPINLFFEKVLVMDKREEIRLNRLALLKEIWSMTSLIADFSKLPEK